MQKIFIFFLACVISQSFVLLTGGNSWDRSGGSVGNSGYTFTKLPASFDTYFYSGSQSAFRLLMFIKSTQNITYTMTLNGVTTASKKITNSSTITSRTVGNFTSIVGYNKITITISGKVSLTTGVVEKFDLRGTFTDLTYVTDSSWFYWGRRGPSCHLAMNGISSSKVQYFYSQVRVPVGYDPIGSYYMANGFGQGYFGIQVNSKTQRRVLFSIWSGWDTDNPNQIPDEYTVKLNKSGPGVTTGQFGGQGSGGQSYLIFNWTTGQTYKFLVKAQPLASNATTYTAWFGDQTNQTTGGWRLIASWTRPKIQTYLIGLYHFIESFSTNYGNQTRMAQYKNQRYYDQSGTWKEVIKTKFTKDSTANSNQRRDTDGGVLLPTGNSFYLKNCGFFNQTKPYGTIFTRSAVGGSFSINFANLPY